jgi:hypothetical protein
MLPGVVAAAFVVFVLFATGDQAAGTQARDGAREPFAWSPDRPLSWSDYLGRAHPGGGASAATAYRLAYEEACTDDGFDFRVQTFFEPDRAWVNSSVLLNNSNSRRLLDHEQAHFDLAEVEARRLRRTLGQLPDACDRPPADRRALILRHLRDDAETQARYDRETRYGTNDLQQGRWTDDIKKQLASLAKFADGFSGSTGSSGSSGSSSQVLSDGLTGKPPGQSR